MLLWSTRTEVETGWRAAGLAGEVPDDALLVSLVNRGANKLDPFQIVESTFRATRANDGTTDVTRCGSVIDNRTPEGEIAYIAGPNPETGTAYGENRGILTVNAPGRASHLRLGGLPLVVSGGDGASVVVGAEVRVARGERRTVEATFTLPSGTDSLRLLPSARLPPGSGVGRGPRRSRRTGPDARLVTCAMRR